jgi:hypothetical protein
VPDDGMIVNELETSSPVGMPRRQWVARYLAAP